MSIYTVFEYIIIFLKCIIIGICAIIPGVSGSVIAVSLGIYERVLMSLTFNKKNILFFIVLLIGLIIGMYYTSGFILRVTKYKTVLYYCLIGVILSELPFILKKTCQEDSRGILVFPFLLSLSFSLVLDIVTNSNIEVNYSKIRFLIGGFLFSFGKVFPGISSSFFLISLGIYENIIVVITNPIVIVKQFDYYFPFIFGMIIGTLIFIYLLRFLFNNKKRLLYSIILGFIVSSVIVIMPKFYLSIENIIGIMLMIILFILLTIVKNKKND